MGDADARVAPRRSPDRSALLRGLIGSILFAAGCATPPAAPREEPHLALTRRVLEREAGHKLDPDQRERVARVLSAAQDESGFPVFLSLAIMQQESGFDPAARGPSGSIGLMQLQPATARALARRIGLSWHSDRTLLDPVANARIGMAYLVEMRNRFGTTEHAVAAYNIGPGNLQRLLRRGELRHGPYLTKVYARADALRAEYGGSTDRD
jgi:soluble lytic murein transglycosylase-like protein